MFLLSDQHRIKVSDHLTANNNKLHRKSNKKHYLKISGRVIKKKGKTHFSISAHGNRICRFPWR